MGSLRPLIVKLVGHISSISHHTSTSAPNSGEDGSEAAQKQFPWRVRGAASRVQGDSVLQTGMHEDVQIHVITVAPVEPPETKGGNQTISSC